MSKQANSGRYAQVTYDVNVGNKGGKWENRVGLHLSTNPLGCEGDRVYHLQLSHAVAKELYTELGHALREIDEKLHELQEGVCCE